MSKVSKWASTESGEECEVFGDCREVEAVCEGLTALLLAATSRWGLEAHGALAHCGSEGPRPRRPALTYVMGLANVQALDCTIEYLSKLVKAFYRLSPRLARLKKDNPLTSSKHELTVDRLCTKRFLLVEALRTLIDTILGVCLFREDSRKLIETCLNLVSLHNQLTCLSSKTFVAKFNKCSNICPSILTEIKPITLSKIVQSLAKSRVEVNCQRLIDCLLQCYRPDSSRPDPDGDGCSTTSESLEIYQALTKHITPPTSTASRNLSVEQRREAFVENRKAKMKQCRSLMETKSDQDKMYRGAVVGQTSDNEVPYASLARKPAEYEDAGNLNGMLQSEEIYVEILLDTVTMMSPVLLGTDGVKKLKNGGVRVQKKCLVRVLQQYQHALWAAVGARLEHTVLWWSPCPLANRPPSTSQDLREWLTTFNPNNTPDLILSALRMLADALGCHVTLTSWDKLFGQTLTTNLQPVSMKSNPDLSVYITECSESGWRFALTLQQLVSLSNQCEVSGEYILGAPLHQLPLVEQIPILHRLDHSIHTCRLWALAETRRLANNWQMNDFFRIAHNDIQACMEQLLSLRFADHTQTIESGNIGVHENVCANMREKLVSEIKVNIQKLKDASEEIIAMLASVCATTSLAHLTMIFPSNAAWRSLAGRAQPDPDHSKYVYHFLDRILLPVARATEDASILNMVLRIMCESWLHHIYVANVKFSKEAATQLLADFGEVKAWLNHCKSLTPNCRKEMLNNEVLRRCEGVGRLLLHTPGDLISMQDSTAQQSMQQIRKEETSEGGEQLMPAEMYVPNQKQWLTLRARRLAPPACIALCCANTH